LPDNVKNIAEELAMKNHKLLLTFSAVLCIVTTTAAAESSFQVGQTIKSLDDNLDAVCLSLSDIQPYLSAGAACAFGSAGDCSLAKKLEETGACGARYGTYVVLSVDQNGWMQISPTADRSKTYWASDIAFTMAQ
jgi:hypothetical protein